MIMTSRCFRVLQMMSFSVMLFALPAWAQHSYRDANDDPALTSQDGDDEADDNGQQFEQELSDIERQYSDLVPDSAKSTAIQAVPNDSNNDQREGEE